VADRPSRLVYLGTPEAAVPPLRALVDADFEVALVVSQPDRKRGRGGALVPSPVKAAAEELGLAVTDRVDDALDAGADLGVVVAFGRLIKPHVLERLPMVNVHFSLLPRWRGAAPVERAVLAGDAETGVCIMALEEELDSGPIYARHVVPIDDDEQADELRHRLVTVGTELLVHTLAGGLPDPEPQVGEPTYAAKIDPAELELEWERPAVELQRLARIGRAWTTFRGRRLKVLRSRLGVDARPLAPGELDGTVVGTGEGRLELVTVQPEGKGPQPAAAWRNGARPEPGERLGA
jgi:methionyl-tRNA formyltransferase